MTDLLERLIREGLHSGQQLWARRLRADEDVQAGLALRGRSLALLPLASPGPPSAQTGPWQTGQMVVDSNDVYWTWTGSVWRPVNGGPVEIGGTTLSAAAASVTFALPPNFHHCQIIWQARSDAATFRSDLCIIFNGDTGANYGYQQLYENNAVVGVGQGPGLGTPLTVFVGSLAGANATAGYPGSGEIMIPNYGGSTFIKHAIGRSLEWDNTTSSTNIWLFATRGLIWNSTAAINSITLQPPAGNFVAGSVFTPLVYL